MSSTSSSRRTKRRSDWQLWLSVDWLPDLMRTTATSSSRTWRSLKSSIQWLKTSNLNITSWAAKKQAPKKGILRPWCQLKQELKPISWWSRDHLKTVETRICSSCSQLDRISWIRVSKPVPINLETLKLIAFCAISLTFWKILQASRKSESNWTAAGCLKRW